SAGVARWCPACLRLLPRDLAQYDTAAGRRRQARTSNSSAARPMEDCNEPPTAQSAICHPQGEPRGVHRRGGRARGFAGWASTTDIAGAVIASGTVVVETNVKKVQHHIGGIIGE